MKNNSSPFMNRMLVRMGNLAVKKGHVNNTPDNLNRLRFLAASAYTGITYILCLALFSNIPRGDTLNLLSDIALLVVITTLICLSRYGGYYKIAFNITVGMLIIILPVGYFSGSADRSLFLTPVTILYAYFLLGKIGGVTWTLLLYIINAVVYGADAAGLVQLQISSHYILNSSIALFFISLLLYIFEKNNEINEELIKSQSIALSESYASLQQELQEKVTLTDQLQKTIKETEKSNSNLESSTRALLNVLEDSNELQEQLAQEKRDVEKKIEMRTRQLQEEQARLHASIDTLDLGFMMTLTNGKSIMHNPALTRIFKLDDAAHQGKLLQMLHKELQGTYDLKKAIKQCLDTGEAFIATDLLVNGTYIRILGSAIRVNKNSECIGVVLLVEDMSDAKMLERSKDEFVSIASHELRTPLTAIRGNLTLMQLLHGDKFTDKEIAQMMEDTTDSVVRLISIVNQFLTTSRLEQKKTVFELAPTEPGHVINHAVNDLRALAQESGLDIKVKLQINLPHIIADGGRLQSVLNNLIGNAIKYTDSGTVTVSAERAGNSVAIRVVDTGKGIDSNNQRMLFQKFQQATDNILTRDDSRSTGLGLYIAKLMVEQMNGTIVLESSKPGKGSVFKITFPTV